MERKHKIKDGHIVVENPLFQELPTHEVTIKSGRTLYRFTGSYDGERSLPQGFTPHGAGKGQKRC